jgi:membrane-associated HD superfamily phosphohydrolase
MARSKDQLKEYATELAKEKGLSESQTQIAVAVMTGDLDALKDVPIADVVAAVVPVADQAIGRRADHSRAMNEAQQIKTRAEADYARNKEWHDKALPAHQQALADAAALKKKLDAYETEYGSLDSTVDIGGGQTVTATGKVVKTEDLEKLRSEVQSATEDKMAKQFVAFEVEKSRLQRLHWQRFKEPLDTEELLALVGKHSSDPVNPRQISLTDAHNELYGEKIQQLDTDARAAEIKAAETRGEEKGRKAAAASMSRSGAAIPEESGALFAHLAAERKAGDKPLDQLSDDEAAAAFDKDFNEALASSPATT